MLTHHTAGSALRDPELVLQMLNTASTTGIECDEKAYGLALTKLHGVEGPVDEMLAAE